jgi:hypothetical protein
LQYTNCKQLLYLKHVIGLDWANNCLAPLKPIESRRIIINLKNHKYDFK